MVQLPNPLSNSLVATANGLGGGVTNNGGNAVGDDQEQQQPQQDETAKAGANSAPSNSQDALHFSSTADVEITPAAGTSASASGTVKSEDDAEQVTLLSTPSVSIFQVAHRAVGSSNTVLQPVAAVTGFNHPLSTPPVKPLSACSVQRGAKPKAGGRPAVEMEPAPISSNMNLTQLLAQSPSADATEPGTSVQLHNLPVNGPQSITATTAAAAVSTTSKQQTNTVVRQAESGRGVRASRRESASADACSSVSLSPLPSENSPCRVPLVKYVDLDMVSSPTRPRPGSTTGMRRQSQGSNSNSPDPSQGRSAATKSRIAAQNPSSPALLNSPLSPALQAPASPFSYRKQQHYAYRQQQQQQQQGQDLKAFTASDVAKSTGDRLASPSHPSQCSSPFSRPSSRSQVGFAFQ